MRYLLKFLIISSLIAYSVNDVALAKGKRKSSIRKTFKVLFNGFKKTKKSKGFTSKQKRKIDKKEITNDKLDNLEQRLGKTFKGQIVKNNKKIGLLNENLTEKILEKMYPKEKGFRILKEVYLVDKNGKKLTIKIGNKNEGRRLDFVVIKDGKVVRILEVTTKTANKKAQMLKEKSIRKLGDVYIKDKETGKLIPVPKNIKTEIIREFEGL